MLIPTRAAGEAGTLFDPYGVAVLFVCLNRMEDGEMSFAGLPSVSYGRMGEGLALTAAHSRETRNIL